MKLRESQIDFTPLQIIQFSDLIVFSDIIVSVCVCVCVCSMARPKTTTLPICLFYKFVLLNRVWALILLFLRTHLCQNMISHHRRLLIATGVDACFCCCPNDSGQSLEMDLSVCVRLVFSCCTDASVPGNILGTWLSIVGTVVQSNWMHSWYTKTITFLYCVFLRFGSNSLFDCTRVGLIPFPFVSKPTVLFSFNYIEFRDSDFLLLVRNWIYHTIGLLFLFIIGYAPSPDSINRFLCFLVCGVSFLLVARCMVNSCF